VTTQKLYLSRVYAVLAWVLAAIAVLHMGTTFRLAAATAFTKVWFFGAGVAMAQTALLNLLHRAYGRTALAWVTRASNAVMLGLAAVGGLVTGASAAELVFMLGALGALLVLSFVFGAIRTD
jgi:hypothetical protein